MGNSPAVFTSLTPTHIAAAMLYLIVGLAGIRFLYPKLAPWLKRLSMLVFGAHGIALVMSTGVFSSSNFDLWLWHLDSEWNIPSTLASAQLVLVGFVAMATAGVSAWRPGWHRLYYLVIGLVFVFLACDEFFLLHESWGNWSEQYFNLGAVLTVATIVVALQSPRHTWICHGFLILGLGLSGLGATQFETYSFLPECRGWQVAPLFGVCSSTIFVEESLELLGIWLALLAIAGQFSDASAKPPRAVILALCLSPLLWSATLTQSGAIKPIGTQTTAEGADVAFESKVELHGFQLDWHKRDGYLNVQLYLSLPGRQLSGDYDGAGYGLILLDRASMEAITVRDVHANTQREFWLAPGYVPVYRQSTRLDFPPDLPKNRAMLILLTLWHEQNSVFKPQRVLSSDVPMLGDYQVILEEFTLKYEAGTQSGSPLAVFENEFVLDDAALPFGAEIGENLEVAFTWSAKQSSDEDIVQFLHFFHEDSGRSWGFDQQPLGARLPTRLWYQGMSDSETWHLRLPADLPTGRYNLYTGLYLTRDQRRVPAENVAGIAFPDARIPLGDLLVEALGAP